MLIDCHRLRALLLTVIGWVNREHRNKTEEEGKRSKLRFLERWSVAPRPRRRRTPVLQLHSEAVEEVEPPKRCPWDSVKGFLGANDRQ